MWGFYFFGALLIWQGIASLVGGFRYLAYVRREMKRPLVDFTPRASVIVPCRGVDQGLRDNLKAILEQQYPVYEVVFVVDDASDPALRVVNQALDARPSAGNLPTARVVVAGLANDSGQKVHNLLAAVRVIEQSSQVLVFVDTDARPRADWLRSLVAPLADASIGAATGYRWFLPVAGGLASHLRAVWNASIASALGARRDRNFCWGGSTAIRRQTFDQLDMRQRWRGTLSDDFVLTRTLQAAKLPIHFVPQCLTSSHEDCSLKELFEFTTRQVKITRVYAPALWRIILAGNLLFVATFFGGLAVVSKRAWQGEAFLIPLALLLVIFLLGAGKAALRLRAVSLPLTAGGERLTVGDALAHLTLWPLTAGIYLANAISAACSRRIEWRGINYELKSPTETVIIHGVTKKPSPITSNRASHAKQSR